VTSRIIHDDNIHAMTQLADAGVRAKLLYMDPPFYSDADYFHAPRDGGPRVLAFTDRWPSLESYVSYLRLRCIVAREMLHPNGCLVVHVDTTAGAYVRVMLDQVFGRACFASEIIWRYRRWPARTPNFQRVHDTLYRYVRDARAVPTWNQLFEPLAASTIATFGAGKQKAVVRDGKRVGSKTAETPSPGVAMGDVWDISIVAPSGHERTGYPTQKPEALLERLVLACTDVGDTVLDPYCGSGTTIAVADRLGRVGIGIDASAVAVRVAAERLGSAATA
jgi:hypothetical protein